MTMKKQEYMKPTMQIVELRQRTMILSASTDEYGMNRNLNRTEEVDEAW